MRYICRSSRGLSLSTSHWSVSVSPGKPQTWASARPLTGLEPPGLGNHRRMLQVGQLGPPHMETSPCAAMVHSVLYGSAANMSSPHISGISPCVNCLGKWGYPCVVCMETCVQGSSIVPAGIKEQNHWLVISLGAVAACDPSK